MFANKFSTDPTNMVEKNLDIYIYVYKVYIIYIWVWGIKYNTLVSRNASDVKNLHLGGSKKKNIYIYIYINLIEFFK